MNPKKLKSGFKYHIILCVALVIAVLCSWTIPPLYKRFRLYQTLQSTRAAVKKREKRQQAHLTLLNLKHSGYCRKLQETFPEGFQKKKADSFEIVHKTLMQSLADNGLHATLVGLPAFEKPRQSSGRTTSRHVTFSFRVRGTFEAFYRFLKTAIRKPFIRGVPELSVSTEQGMQYYKIRIRAALK